jgi:hypothetical protein
MDFITHKGDKQSTGTHSKLFRADKSANFTKDRGYHALDRYMLMYKRFT